MKKVMVSGCYDPLHLGHLYSFREAKKLGDKLIVVIDGDDYTISKKGAVFMPIMDRAEIISELRCVDKVIPLREGHKVSKIILKEKPEIFAKGGDIVSESQLTDDERNACSRVGCKIIFGVGGKKIRGSSDLLREWVKKSMI